VRALEANGARRFPTSEQVIADVSAGRRQSTARRAIRVGPALLVLQDRLTRERFLREWARSTQAARSAQ